MKQIIECVPNFSEGADSTVIKAIAAQIRKIKGVRLLHVDSGVAANRTVYTFIGQPLSVLEAAFQAIKTASELIDMRTQKGEHPRIGACDVCPLIPIQNISMQEVIDLSHQLAKRVADQLNIPVYLYEESAQKADRKLLANIRKGEYEGLAEKMKQPHWKADYAWNSFNAKSGATVIGARNFLIAYNFNLATADEKIASEIAAEIREKGRYIGKNEKGEKVFKAGKFKSLRAIGWFINDFGIAQVSCNFTNYQLTPIHLVHEEIKSLAIQHQTELTGSELIGLIPKAALIMAANYYDASIMDENEQINLAVERLGLNQLSEFLPQSRIIDYML